MPQPKGLGSLALLFSFWMMVMSGCASQEPGEVAETPESYLPNWESIKTHQVPEWFHDAKLGIFIHWGLYSVPGWATPTGELGKVDFDEWFTNNPYAEWYLNTLKIEGSPTQKHHGQTYGEDFDYRGFVPIFNEEIKKWDPDAWATLFREVGAQYVVLTSKHHDGFTLWPSQVTNPNLPADRTHASRDLVGELTEAVRRQGLRMGLYYSGGLDWSYNPKPIETRDDVFGTVIHTEAYARYADAHWRELIAKYAPKILWNDIGYPKQGDLLNILADYYNAFPDGIINNRFRQTRTVDPATSHWDFTTPEYAKMNAITHEKWESCRGLGFSFGYNQMEGPEHVLSADALVDLLVDIVSKNGNLLINVGPKADGTIPDIQVDRLRALGNWLDVNGEAVYGTRPWQRAEGKTTEGVEIRFTRKDEAVYTILLDKPKTRQITIEPMQIGDDSNVVLLGYEEPLVWSQVGENLTLTLPQDLSSTYAYAIKISSQASAR